MDTFFQILIYHGEVHNCFILFLIIHTHRQPVGCVDLVCEVVLLCVDGGPVEEGWVPGDA